eukprot:TRINITY_DN74768_c0_g1_i1.p1 TRINITY_DN74768_c0_g1~~TRINITY_DN74768_c0_g1_i1.p1  ORF type:complete len:1208 (-),score=425.25 TRINITY_DN74768_c0_g1_i1:78-3701(-)
MPGAADDLRRSPLCQAGSLMIDTPRAVGSTSRCGTPRSGTPRSSGAARDGAGSAYPGSRGGAVAALGAESSGSRPSSASRMSPQARSVLGVTEAEVIRLQTLLQNRDRQLEEMARKLHALQAGPAEAKAEAARESEQEMRCKLEKLLDVQTVQVELQKELRAKTQKLLQVERESSARLKQQLAELQQKPGGEVTAAVTADEQVAALQEQVATLRSRNQELEKQLGAAAVATAAAARAASDSEADRKENQATLMAQLDAKEQTIQQLQRDIEARSALVPTEAEVIRLQMLVQNRDRQLDEVTEKLRKAEAEAAAVTTEVEVLRQHSALLKKDVDERSDEAQQHLGSERLMRNRIFELEKKLEETTEQHAQEAEKAGQLAEFPQIAEERKQRISLLEQELQEVQRTAQLEREEIAVDCERKVRAKEQAVKQQTGTIEHLTFELKEKQAQIDKLTLLSSTGSPSPPLDQTQLLSPSSPVAGADTAQRSLESLHRQLRTKDAKIAKQTEQLATLTEMLEKRDEELEGLSTARRDREQMRARLAEMQEVMNNHVKASSHAEAEHRLIVQETRLVESDRKMHELEEALVQEEKEKEAARAGLEKLQAKLQDVGVDKESFAGERKRVEDERQKAVEELERLKATMQEQRTTEEQVRQVLEAEQKRLVGEKEKLQGELSSHVDEKQRLAADLKSAKCALEEKEAELLRLRSADCSPSRLVHATGETGSSPGEEGPAVPAAAAHAPPATTGDAPDPEETAMAAQQKGACEPLKVAAVDVVSGKDSLSVEVLQRMSAEEIYQLLVSTRAETHNVAEELTQKKQLTVSLVEEANLCSAEIAELQQALHSAYERMKEQGCHYRKLYAEKSELDKLYRDLQSALDDKDAALKAVEKTQPVQEAPHEVLAAPLPTSPTPPAEAAPDFIRQSMFLVLRRESGQPLDCRRLACGLAGQLGISEKRLQVTENVNLPPCASNASSTAYASSGVIASEPTTITCGTPAGSAASVPRDHGSAEHLESFDQQMLRCKDVRRDLVLVTMLDKETNEAGEERPCLIPACDVFAAIRSDFAKGRSLGKVDDDTTVDAVFLNHGDLAVSWPESAARLVLREARQVAGKYAIVTLHEVADPYVLRIVAYDSEVGVEFTLYLRQQDVADLLGAADVQAGAGQQMAAQFLAAKTVADSAAMSDTILSSLAFSLFEGRQILVASEMRVPVQLFPRD